MDELWTTAQVIVIGVSCLAVGIVIGAGWVLQTAGGLLLGKGK
jgi:hypothetical protein